MNLSPVCLPIALMVIDLAACVWYSAVGDYPRGMYWFAAGLITCSTLLIK